jgi:hypothetical protein
MGARLRFWAILIGACLIAALTGGMAAFYFLPAKPQSAAPTGADAAAASPAANAKYGQLCEETIKDKLKSPISYKRASMEIQSEQHGTRWYYELMLRTQFQIEFLKDAKNKDTSFDLYYLFLTSTDEYKRSVDDLLKKHPAELNVETVSVSMAYDAANGFGAMIRAQAKCGYFILDGAELNGMRSFENAQRE